ncbi:MAG: rod shape-determining protein RodA [Castellaniella sp.]
MKRLYRWFGLPFAGIDWPLLALVILLALLGMTIMHSAVGDTDWRFAEQLRNFLIAFLFLWGASLVPPAILMRLAPWIYALGLVLLLGVEFFGETSKGATRWLHLGLVRIQPSEMMKIAVPLMLAWYFHQNAARFRLLDLAIAMILVLLPFALIVHQPDLGTALLVLAAGLCVIYFAGLPFAFIIPITIVLLAGIGIMVVYQESICHPDFEWALLRDYQKYRVCTLLDPSSDPLGKGFHTIQSMIAVGSGGIYGKGYMLGTQAHLDFIPERTTDFIFAVYAEEFGLYGGIMLLVLHSLLIVRGLSIAAGAPTQFGRLLAASTAMMFFVYVFVNVGMVTGMLPVVGVPLPFMSYGGTALLTQGIACGILMSIHHHPQPPGAAGG